MPLFRGKPPLEGKEPPQVRGKVKRGPTLVLIPPPHPAGGVGASEAHRKAAVAVEVAPRALENPKEKRTGILPGQPLHHRLQPLALPQPLLKIPRLQRVPQLSRFERLSGRAHGRNFLT